MEALELKSRTENILIDKGVPINEHLPKIEEISELSFASVEMIRKRAVALSYVLARAFGAPFDLIQSSIKEHNLNNIFTPKELELIESPNPSKKLCQEFQFEVEALWELTWVLQLIPKISHWVQCENDLVHLVPKPGEDPSNFLGNNQMRRLESIYEEADLLFRLHWASREAVLTRQPEL